VAKSVPSFVHTAQALTTRPVSTSVGFRWVGVVGLSVEEYGLNNALHVARTSWLAQKHLSKREKRLHHYLKQPL